MKNALTDWLDHFSLNEIRVIPHTSILSHKERNI
jgi:hypothetical protein